MITRVQLHEVLRDRGRLAGLAGRIAMHRRLDGGASNRHDTKRWIREFAPTARVALDALEEGKRGLAISVLCAAVPLEDAIGLTLPPLGAPARNDAHRVRVERLRDRLGLQPAEAQQEAARRLGVFPRRSGRTTEALVNEIARCIGAGQRRLAVVGGGNANRHAAQQARDMIARLGLRLEVVERGSARGMAGVVTYIDHGHREHAIEQLNRDLSEGRIRLSLPAWDLE